MIIESDIEVKFGLTYRRKIKTDKRVHVRYNIML